MDDLAERIKASLENPDGEPWFPQLTPYLAAQAWSSLYREIGLTPDSYSTERVLARSISAPRQIVTTLKSSRSSHDLVSRIFVEALTENSENRYQKQGVSFYSTDEVKHTTILSCLEDALAVINKVPSLMRTVAALVQSLHVLKPQDDEHDFSFSEPHVPFSVFVSVPQERIANDALRVAEAIVHEAMHLQLTLVEDTTVLSVVSPQQFFSPWKGEYRTLQGVLHGLYVFRVVDWFLAGLLKQELSYNKSYLGLRHDEISSQIEMIRDLQECSDLSEAGTSLVSYLTRA